MYENKYVVLSRDVKDKDTRPDNKYIICVFTSHLPHKEMANRMIDMLLKEEGPGGGWFTATSAGFCAVNKETGKWEVWGVSESLRLKSDPKDADLLNKKVGCKE